MTETQEHLAGRGDKMDNPKRRRAAQSERGQSWIEFVFTMPALVILFLGLVEVGLALRAQLVMTNANREAARYASHGIFSDEQIAARAVSAFAGQLPVTLSGEEANTCIIITHFHVPTGDEEAIWETQYITGTQSYTNRNDEVINTPSKLLEPDPETNMPSPANYAQKLKRQNADFFTANDIVIVETYYHHRQILNAPFIAWAIPEPIVLYMRTAMRVSRSKVGQ